MKLLDLANTDAKAIVDDDDFEVLQWYRWRRLPVHPRGWGGYVNCSIGVGTLRHIVLLHRFLLGTPKNGFIIDHIDGNVLDNRRCNLRETTPQKNLINRHRQDSRNKSGVRGVMYQTQPKFKNKWGAEIRVKGKMFYLGHYATKEEAVAVRRAAELKHFGELCPLIEVSS